MPVDLAGFAYAALVAAGGAFGYYKAGKPRSPIVLLLFTQANSFVSCCYQSGSIPSLGAGLLFGSALAYGAWQVSQDPANYSTQLAASSILAGVMGYRFYNSGKIMPAGLVCAISVAMIVRIGFNAVTAPNKSLK